MAVHGISGYISSLWKALFASFIQVFARIFRFTKTRNSPTQDQHQPQPPQPQLQPQPQQPQQEPSSTSTAIAHSQCNNQDTSSSYSPDTNTPYPVDQHHLHHYHHHHNANHTHTHTHTHTHSHCNQQQHSKQLDHDIDSGALSEGGEDEEGGEPDMPRSKKRGGKKRNGAKANGQGRGNGHGHGTGPGPGPGPNANTSTSVHSTSTTGQPNDKGYNPASSRLPSGGSATNQHAAPQHPPSKVQTPAPPAVAVPVTNQRDTRPNDSRTQPDAQKLNGFRRAGPRIPDRPSPTKQTTADKKENAATSKDAPQAATVSHAAAQVPTVAPLAVNENRTLPQKLDVHNVTGHGKSDTPVKPQNQENIPPNVQVDQLRTAIDGLTFDETPAPATKSPEKGPNGTTTSKSAPLLPVPVIVPFPGATRQPQPKTNIPLPNLPGLIEPKTEEERKEREYHLKFMREALDMGQLALNTNETPVGCVLVYHGRIIAKGMNATNVTRNGTRHAEFMALSALFSRRERGDVEDVNNNPALDDACWGDVDPRDGHIFPYGQKLHPAPVVDRAIISECVLYVTVEPCVMCASLLRQLGVKKVYFGAVNDKFGGTGGVFRIHLNSKPISKPADRPYQNGYGPTDVGRITKGRAMPLPREEEDGDGGNVEPGYPVEGGYLRDDAVSLLRRFYVQENGRAPQPRKKEGRAARLFAMEAAAKGGSASEMSDSNTLPDTPVDNEPLPTIGAKLDPTPVVLSTDAPNIL